MKFDVAIIGGGPAGSTAACMLKKYAPDLRVAVFERETFPRDHVGESQLPPICAVLDEIGCWDKVEAAGFPIKVGATYKWGANPELWDFEFVPHEKFKDEPRPAKFEGQRRFTAFQVDRAIYDKILLDHALEMGAEIFQPQSVRQVLTDGDRVSALQLDDGTTVEARYYVDASGHTGILRRAMGVEIDCPTGLQNIALWDYWQDAEWAVSIGTGGTRIQIISVPYGWIWFIPLGPTRTSVGLVVPASYYKETKLKPEELYRKSLGEDPLIVSLMKNAESEGKFSTTKDWSFLSERVVGENWFLIGESAGFADPILSAGLTMAQVGAKELAYTIFELDRREYPANWLKEQFSQKQRERILNHMRFADYWYSANAQFKDLKVFTSGLAKDSGLDLDPDKAWQWLGQGGFINEDEETGSSGFSLQQVKQLGSFLNDLHSSSVLSETNEFRLNFADAQISEKATYADGRIGVVKTYRRGSRLLPLNRNSFGFLVKVLEQCSHWPEIDKAIIQSVEHLRPNPDLRDLTIYRVLQAFEAMVLDGWVTASRNPDLPLRDMRLSSLDIRVNTDQLLSNNSESASPPLTA
jgi:flavin-dependent dehydrogenase